MAIRRLPLLLAALCVVACSRPGDVEAPARDDALSGAGPLHLEGRYRLVRVDGDSLPARVDRRPGCSLELVYGALTLRADRFYFTDTTRERCEGETPRQESWIAQGRYETSGETLRFHPDSGTAFGAAEGVRGAGAGELLLLRLHTEAGPEEVEWLFVRRDRPGR